MAAAGTPPLTLGEILDRTIQLYRRNFLLFLGIAAGPAASFVLISGGFSLYITSHAGQFQGTPNVTQMLTFLGVLAGFFVIGLPLLLAVSSVALSALTYAAALAERQLEVTIGSAYSYAFRKFWRYLGVLSLQMLFASVVPGAVFAGIVVIGSVTATLLAVNKGSQALAALVGISFFVLIIAFVVAMVVIWLRFCLAFPASLVEDLKAWPALQRSNRLSKGTRGRIFVMYLLVGILVIVIYYAMIFPADLILGLTLYKSSQFATLLMKPPLIVRVVNLFIGFLQRAFVMPIYCIGLLLFYNDQRTRQEGYDIELLMAQAGWDSQYPAAQAPAAQVWAGQSWPGQLQEAPDKASSGEPFAPSAVPHPNVAAPPDAPTSSVSPLFAEASQAEATKLDRHTEEANGDAGMHPPEASGA